MMLGLAPPPYILFIIINVGNISVVVIGSSICGNGNGNG
jgi:hypothetical protein